MDEIMQNLEQHIRKTYDIENDDDEFTLDVHLFDYGYVDSMGATELIAYIEKKYGVEITNQDLMLYPLNTIREIATLIHNKMGR